RLVSFGILWFFITLSIESSVIPIRDVIFEHRLYLPSVGFFLVASLLAGRAWGEWSRSETSTAKQPLLGGVPGAPDRSQSSRNLGRQSRCSEVLIRKKIRIPLVVVGLLIIGGFSLASFQRNRIWKDPLTLWQDVVNKAPRKGRGYYGLGKAYQVEGRFEPAIEAYLEAIALRPDYFDAWLNLGVACKNLGRLEEAVRAYQGALRIEPDSAGAHHNLGNTYKKLGQIPEAIREFEEVLRIQPDFEAARRALEELMGKSLTHP
ncbi:MAG: tetratricopeptide repeat protein, partial [Deltaproteobacteria bacterium]|nr:tetratricopeptide repeat protein [Deltaproteobacteria bacterium]